MLPQIDLILKALMQTWIKKLRFIQNPSLLWP